MHPERIASRLRSWFKRSRTFCAAVGLLFITDGLYTQYHLATQDHLPIFSTGKTHREAAIGIWDHEDHDHDSSHHPHSRLDHAPQCVTPPAPHFIATYVAIAAVPFIAKEPEPSLLPSPAPPFEARGSPRPSPRQPRAPPVS